MTMDLARAPSPGSLSSEGSRHRHWGHARAPSGPAVLERLDQMDKSLESVSRVANKAKVITLPNAMTCLLRQDQYAADFAVLVLF